MITSKNNANTTEAAKQLEKTEEKSTKKLDEEEKPNEREIDPDVLAYLSKVSMFLDAF